MNIYAESNMFLLQLLCICMKKRKKNALVAGATGSTGRHLVRQLNASTHYDNVIVVHRRPTGFADLKKVTEIVLDFNDLENQLNTGVQVHDVFCALGTTMKKAGSKEQFSKVDYNYVVELAKWSRLQKAQQFTVISSIGAKISSPFFYLKTKGHMEEKLKKMELPSLHIMRPSILEDPDREETRTAEKISLGVMKIASAILPGLLKNHKPTPVWMLAHAMITVALQEKEGIHYYYTNDIHQIANKKNSRD